MEVRTLNTKTKRRLARLNTSIDAHENKVRALRIERDRLFADELKNGTSVPKLADESGMSVAWVRQARNRVAYYDQHVQPEEPQEQEVPS